MVNDNRPKFLNVLLMYFPITAVISIFHRISGVLIFFLLPVMLLLCSMIKSARSLQPVEPWLPFVKFSYWAIVSLFIYHSLAGMRHLLADFGVAESYRSSKISAWFILLLALVLSGALFWVVWL